MAPIPGRRACRRFRGDACGAFSGEAVSRLRWSHVNNLRGRYDRPLDFWSLYDLPLDTWTAPGCGQSESSIAHPWMPSELGTSCLCKWTVEAVSGLGVVYSWMWAIYGLNMACAV